MAGWGALTNTQKNAGATCYDRTSWQSTAAVASVHTAWQCVVRDCRARIMQSTQLVVLIWHIGVQDHYAAHQMKKPPFQKCGA